MSGDTEMQHLHPGRPSDQSSRTAVPVDQVDTKSENLLQLILDELRNNNEAKNSASLARTDTRDFGSVPSPSQPNLFSPSRSLPDLARGVSNDSSESLRSLSHPSEERFYEKLFAAVVAFAAFGGSITFQCIFQTFPNTTENPDISPRRARTFIAISWLLFTMDLSLSSIILAALYVCKTRAAKDDERENSWNKRKVQIFRYVNLIAALILPLGSVAALIFAALAVSVLSMGVGKTALISVIVLGGSIVLWWFAFCIRHCYRNRSASKNSV